MERRGSGFRKILDAVKFAPNYTEENLPVFNSNPYSFSVAFKNMNYGVEPMAEENTQKTDLNVGVNVETVEKNCGENSITVEKSCGENKNSVEKILSAIKENPNITQVGLSEIAGLTRRGIEYQLRQLKNKGLIRRVGADKGGHWEVVTGAENKNK